MKIQISPSYYQLRIHELELTSDYPAKRRGREGRHNAANESACGRIAKSSRRSSVNVRGSKRNTSTTPTLAAPRCKGDQAGAARVREQLAEVAKAVENVDYRAANIRAGYVYVISNIGSFGEKMIKIGMTRRLEPMDRIRELSDASVPFNFDVHALFFSNDAVSIETELHDDSRTCA